MCASPLQKWRAQAATRVEVMDESTDANNESPNISAQEALQREGIWLS
jgi:hypothetical protein